MAVFLDTNVIVYASIDDHRTDRALAVMAEPFHISTQTLNEFIHVSRRKLKRSWTEIEVAIEDIMLSCAEVHSITPQTQLLALSIAKRHDFSIHDAQIIASALEAGCSTLYSEDMQGGMVIDSRLTIRNPFA